MQVWPKSTSKLFCILACVWPVQRPVWWLVWPTMNVYSDDFWIGGVQWIGLDLGPGMEDKEVWIVGTTGTIWFRWLDGDPDPGRLDTNRWVGWHREMNRFEETKWYYTYGDTVFGGQRQ